MEETPRKFDADFADSAVRVIRRSGKQITQVAREPGIKECTLRGHFQDARPSEVFAAATDEVGRVLNTDVTLLRRYLPGPAAALVAGFAAGQPLSHEEPRLLGGHNITTLVHETGRPARANDSDWLLHGLDGRIISMASGVGARQSSWKGACGG